MHDIFALIIEESSINGGWDLEELTYFYLDRYEYLEVCMYS
jgi:hypothetical protein